MPVSISPAMRRHRLRNPYGGSAGRKPTMLVSSSMRLKLATLLALASPWILMHYFNIGTNNNIVSFRKEPTLMFQQKPDFSAYHRNSEAIKQEFYRRYGGKENALLLLQKTILTFTPNIPQSSPSTESIDGDTATTTTTTTTTTIDYGLNHTAKRIIYALTTNQPLVLSFGGYSITVGRGNYFNQSYPLVLESILKDAVKSLGIPHFEVRNAAIGGIPR
jgi:hypothetical protein